LKINDTIHLKKRDHAESSSDLPRGITIPRGGFKVRRTPA